MIQRTPLSSAAALALTLCAGCTHQVTRQQPAATTATAADRLARVWASPPERARPATYWYWLSDDISREGITRDLLAMKEVGIGEALIGNIDVNRDQRGPVTSLSDEWWDMVAFAIEEGGRIGIDVGLFNSPGWSQSGGPWVSANQTMRFVTHSSAEAHGSASITLPAPTEKFQDIAVLAMPIPDVPEVRIVAPRDVGALFDGLLNKSVNLKTGTATRPTPVSFDVEVDGSAPVRSLSIHPGSGQFHSRATIAAQQPDGTFRQIYSGEIDRRVTRAQLGPMNEGPVTLSFADVRTEALRFTFSPLDDARTTDLTEIKISSMPMLERYVEKQLGKLWQTPEPVWDVYRWDISKRLSDPSLAIDRDSIIDLSDRLRADGTLDWTPPAGRWQVMRFGMAPTGVENGPSTPEATGYEVDKMNAEHVSAHFDAYVGRILDTLPLERRTAFQTVVADSYEQGSQNWTEGFAERFRETYGYDPVPYLPVLTGAIIGSPDESDRFLWDMRRLVADMISYEYVGTLRKRAEENGLRLWIENYGHWGFPGEFMQYGGQAHEVGAEFWVNPETRGEIEIRAAASTAHVYGKDRVSAEAFTNGQQGAWTLAPHSLRKLGDRAAAGGINHFVMHVYAHQPRSDGPGVNAWFGTEFNRNNTWFTRSGEWFDYLRRQHGLLQQGYNVADIAYFIGEDAPVMIGTRDPELPPGYDYDFVNTEALNEILEAGEEGLKRPDGMHYALLALPPSETMTPAMLERISALVEAGANLLGDAPSRSPSLAGRSEADARVRALASRMWSDCEARPDKTVRHGRGKVFCHRDLDKALADLDRPADVTGIEAPSTLWTHRRTNEAEIYFLSNQLDNSQTVAPRFRDTRARAELWDAGTNTRYALPAPDASGSVGAIALAPNQSVFVVFADETSDDLTPYAALASAQPVAVLSAPWEVAFDPDWGGPPLARMPTLTDWTKHEDDGVRYYSGTATYRTTFALPEAGQSGRLILDLGKVRDIAEVRLNGREVGTVWTDPWQIDITDFAHSGANAIEIDVTNGWRNRIIGDLRGAPEDRLTRPTHDHYTAESELESSGLMGPVRILALPR